MSEQSEQINELIDALSKAQGEIVGALKDSKNPFFKSNYADLASVMDAIRSPFSKNGLAYVQTTEADEQGVCVTTMLAHKSGQWIRGKLRMMPKDATPQGIGSCITYARRYALAAIAGVAQIDDDGNAASGRDEKGTTTDPRPEGWTQQDTRKVTEQVKRLQEAVQDRPHTIKSIWDEIKSDESFASAVWAKLPKPVRDYIKDAVKEAA